MLPLSARSPRSRTHTSRRPLPRKAMQLSRPGSVSIISSLKSFVTAPLGWFSTDEEEATPGKRKHLEADSGDTDIPHDLSQRTDRDPKRRRLELNRSSSAYLDPAPSMFSHNVASVPPATKATLPVRPTASALKRKERLRTPPPAVDEPKPSQVFTKKDRTISPLPARAASSEQPATLGRTMSVDPPHLRSSMSIDAPPLRSAMSVDPPSRDVSMLSIPARPSVGTPALGDDIPRSRSLASLGRDTSMAHSSASIGPSASSFRVRPSLTPQPSGPAFGPNPYVQKDETPKLQSFFAPQGTRPFFAKPGEEGDPNVQPQMTLGAFAETQPHKLARPRPYSSLLIGVPRPDSTSKPHPDSSHDASSGSTEAARKALYERDEYRKPLVASRLRHVSDSFRSKQLSLADDLSKEWLGMPREGKEKAPVGGTKPYAGTGGMKKLLARRREEKEREEKERAEKVALEERGKENATPKATAENKKETAIGTDENPVDKTIVVTVQDQSESLQVKDVEPLSEDNFVVRPLEEQEGSSLRIGRTRNFRGHIDRPWGARPKNRFSAAAQDDDEDQMSTTPIGESSKSKSDASPEKPTPTLFAPPAGFSFAKEAPPIEQDMSAKEPPISALPFSLSKSTTPATPTPSTPVPAEKPEGSKPPTLSIVTQPGPASFNSLFTAKTSAATSAPSQPSSEAAAPEKAAAAEADSNKNEKPASESSVPNFFASSSLLSKPVAPLPSAPLSLFGAKPQSLPSLETAAPAKPSGFGSFSIGTPQPASTSTKDTSEPSNNAGSAETNAPPAPAAEPSAPKETPGLSIFGAAKSADAPAPSLFGAPTKPTESSASSLFAPKPVATDATKPAFGSLFGTQAKTPEQGTSSTPVPNLFGAKPSTPQPTETTATPVPEVPKPASPFDTASTPTPSLFAGFGNTAPTTPAAPATPVAKQPFSFGQNVSSTPAGSPPPQAAKFSFGTSGTSLFGKTDDAAAPEKKDEAKSPFSFGAAPSTPPPASDKPAFSFGTAAAASAPATASEPPKLFGGFGAPAQPPKAVTPPREQEMKMDESPIRDTTSQVERPKPLGFSFSAGATSSAPLFGQNSPATPTSFSAGASPATTSGFGFGQKPPETSTTTSGFSFGDKAGGNTAPSSSGFAGFGASTTPTQPSSSSGFSFKFGEQNQQPAAFTFADTSSIRNPFAGLSRTASSSSAPSSPATYTQGSGFGFGAPNPGNVTFGASNPASPAIANPAPPQPSVAFPTPGMGMGSTLPAPSTNPFELPPRPGVPPPRPTKKLPSRRKR